MTTKKRELIETKKEDLPVEITDKERQERSLALARKIAERTRQDDDAKRTAADQSARKKTITAEINRLADVVSSGKEVRPVEVKVWGDFKTSTVVEERSDTGEMLRERAMRSEERQTEIAPPDKLTSITTPKAVAKQLFSDGARPQDAGIEKRVEEAAKGAGVEVGAVLDHLADLDSDAKKAAKGKRTLVEVKKPEGKDSKKEKDDEKK